MKISFLRLSPSSPHSKIEPILFEWFTLIGMFLFAAWLLGLKGVWQLLLQSDPTGITFVIIIIFCVATLWCGTRSRELDRQRGAPGAGAEDQDLHRGAARTPIRPG